MAAPWPPHGQSEAEDVTELLEATGAGVHVYPLDERLAKTVRHHKYLAVRRLVGEVSTAQQRQLEQFIRQVRVPTPRGGRASSRKGAWPVDRSEHRTIRSEARAL